MKSLARRNNLKIDINEFQSRLDALPGSQKNTFTDLVWNFFPAGSAKQTIDFSHVLASTESFENWKSGIDFDLVLVSKIMFLSSAEIVFPGRYKSKFVGLILFWVALARHGTYRLSAENIAAVLTSMLTHGWDRGRLYRYAKVSTSMKFKNAWALDAWRSGSSSIGLELIAPSMSYQVVAKTLKLLIPNLTDEATTYLDWNKGSSHNHLTLDYGQYYLEHCVNFFEANFALATALASVYSIIPEISQSVNIQRESLLNWVLHILEGASFEDLLKKPTVADFNQNKVKSVYQLILKQFKLTYRESRFLSTITKDDALGELAAKLGLEANQSDIDRLRMIVCNWLNHSPAAEITALLRGCNPPIKFQDFNDRLGILRRRSDRQPCKIPTIPEYRAMGLTEAVAANSNRFPRQLIRLTKSAGLTSIVAFTGWRKSEFGFPATAIRSFPNEDKLDQYAFPNRFEIEWYVFKTSGRQLVRREVTFNVVLMARRLRTLIGSEPDMPCLFKREVIKDEAFKSEHPVSKAISALWTHFVDHYPPFQLLDQLSYWQSIKSMEEQGNKLTAAQRSLKRTLLTMQPAKSWDTLEIDHNLREAWHRSRRERPLLDFYFKYASDGEKKDWVTKYQNRSLRKEWLDLLDSSLSDETRAWLNSLDCTEYRSAKVSRFLTRELVADCLYPTPHALRHIWAEAVYRRFDGDAGWMIRSHFHHISRAMWLAYIRDKDNRISHQLAKARVITSLIHNYLKKRGEGYTGQFHVLLRRLMKATHVMTPEEQSDFSQSFATTEIIDIKSNPWGYCLLRSRSQAKAQCAEMGEPQRHNASPELCLGCVHNLMQSSNVDWLLLNLQTHVEALKNDIIPSIFKKPSYRLVKNLTKHIRLLDSAHEALAELDDVLRSYEKGVFVS